MSPRRYKKGVTNVDKGTTMGMFLDMDPSLVYGYFDDFYQYAAADWVISTAEGGAGSATEALSDTGLGGALVLTNAAGSGDHDFLQLSKDGGTNDSETFKFQSGKKLWFKIRFQGNDVDQSLYYAGLYITNTDPPNSAPTDGVYFRSDDGDAYVDLVVTKNSTSTTTTQIATMKDATNIVLGYKWDGVDKIYYYVNETEVGYSATTNLPNDECLALSFGIENGEAAANTMTIDYIGAWMER